MFDLRPIRTEADYDAALAAIEPFFENEPEPGTREADRFDILAALIAAYENEHWRIEAPSPVDAIREVMAIRGYSQKDLSVLLGSPSRASELLNGKRPLNMEQAQKLYREWKVPAECLIAAR
jgi:HTH-type transcriptional regulator/antitoxin HigA